MRQILLKTAFALALLVPASIAGPVFAAEVGNFVSPPYFAESEAKGDLPPVNERIPNAFWKIQKLDKNLPN